jgi:ABC-2 type transport system ATP-binding protein
MAAIEILDLEKSYLVGFWRKRPKLALRPLRLTIEEGEVFGFLGPNGAGKTTTLKLLMGLVFPTAGTADEVTNRISARATLLLRSSERPRTS